MKLRPDEGFCVYAEVAGKRCNGRLFVNVCSHVMVGFPASKLGEKASKDYILKRGLSHLQIPIDCSTFRRLRVRQEGARKNGYAVDVILHPFLVKLFHEDGFCKSVENFRPYFLNLCLQTVERELECKISRDVKLVKKILYTDPDEDDNPREVAEIPKDGADSDDDIENSPPQAELKKKSDDEKPIIEEVSQVSKKPAMKKGFLGNSKKPLYPNGSTEGVLPENAGDPMGWMPKGLRKRCNIVDCNSDEYKKMEAEKEKGLKIEQQNKEAESWNNSLKSDLNKWTKKLVDDRKWQDDTPDSAKYSVDYKRFENIDESDDEKATSSRKLGSTTTSTRPASGGTSQEAEEKKEEELEKEFREFSKLAEAYIPSLGKDAGPGGLEKGFLNKPKKTFPKTNYRLIPTDENVTVEVDTPGLTSMLGVDLQVDNEKCSLEFPNDLESVTIPWRVDPDSVKAKFSKKKQMISITANKTPEDE